MAVMDNSDAAYLNLVLDMVPFFNIFREDMEESINRLAKDLEKCCREIPDVEVIHTGSGFEGLSLPHLDKNQTWNTDADHMIIRTSLKLHEGVKQEEKNIEESVKVEQDWPGESEREEGSSMAAKMVVAAEAAEDVLYIYDASHAGYVHLSNKRLVIPIDSDSVREHCLQNSNFIERNRDLIRLSHNVIMSPETGSIAGPSYSMRSDGGSFNVSRDFVYGLKCERWPVQAKEWIHRDRPQSWPSSELISTISTQGCHIVPVGSHSSNLQEFEWRFSFSVAEMILAGSLTDNQKLAYSVLKALIKSEMKLRDIDLFASYHLKTCLFWFLEKKGVKSWYEQSLGTNVLELLDFITAFYAKGSVPNYFIAKNNMIDHRSTEEILNACHALKDIRASVTQSLCRYIETNQALPVLFDTSLTQQLKENPTKFLQNCKYNFLVMALAYILKKMKKEESYNSNHGHESACSLVIKARILHNATPEEHSKECSKSLSALSEVSHLVENPTANMVLSLLEENLAADQMKVTETSAVALAVFNVFLTLHPSHLDPGFENNSLELHEYLINPTIKECLFWAARVHEKYCDAIYNFVVKKWVNGPQFFTTDEEATKFMKLVMIILGKPTKQASAVTGSLAKRSIEGNRFLLMRFLADYLLHVHLESAYIAFQAAAYLMNKTVLAEIYLTIKWSGYERSKLRAIELVLSKQELQAELSEEEFTRLLEVQHELMTELNVA